MLNSDDLVALATALFQNAPVENADVAAPVAENRTEAA
jgi:hypothetical protein